METKYDNTQGGWSSNDVVGPFRVGVQKYIRKGWGVFLNLSNIR